MKHSIEDIHNEQTQKDQHDRERKLRLWLRPGAFQDEQRRREKTHIGGTNTWFLEHSSFKNWSDREPLTHHIRLLWAYGKAGCGKSILASSVVSRLRKLGFEPLYFFFNSKTGRTLESTPLGLVRTLLVQLLDVGAQISDLLFAEYTKSNTDEASSCDSLWTIFRIWCSRLTDPIFCVIDALDEAIEVCDDTDDFLAMLVDTVVRYPMLRICVTSRQNSQIERHFLLKVDVESVPAIPEGLSTASINRSLEAEKSCISRVLISEDDVNSDLREYIKIKIVQSSKLKPLMTESDIDMLCARAEGMFLWYAYH